MRLGPASSHFSFILQLEVLMYSSLERRPLDLEVTLGLARTLPSPDSLSHCSCTP